MKTLEMNKKIPEKSKGYTYKITPISAANCPRILNLITSNNMTYYSNLLVSYEKYLLLIFVNFIENIRNE